MSTKVDERESFIYHAGVEARCSLCGTGYEYEGGTALFESRGAAMDELLADDGWQVRGDEVVCFYCLAEPNRAVAPSGAGACFVERVCVSVRCSRCGDSLSVEDREIYFQSAAKAADTASGQDWKVDGDRAVCGTCLTQMACAHEWPAEPSHTHEGMEYRYCPTCCDIQKTPAESIEGSRA